MSQIHRYIFVQTKRDLIAWIYLKWEYENENSHIKLLISLMKSKEFATMTQICLRVTRNQHKHSEKQCKVKLAKANSSKLTNINTHRKWDIYVYNYNTS